MTNPSATVDNQDTISEESIVENAVNMNKNSITLSVYDRKNQGYKGFLKEYYKKESDGAMPFVSRNQMIDNMKKEYSKTQLHNYSSKAI